MTWRERMRDSANPNHIPLTWTGAVAGYLHVGDPARPWTKADWARFGKRRKLPIMVRSNPQGPNQAYNDAWRALEELYDLRVPHGCYVALDRETSADKDYCARWASIIRWGGYQPVDYHSASVTNMPGFAFTWGAWYRRIGPFMMSRPARMTQYASPSTGSGGDWDSSTVRPWTYFFGRWWR